MHFNNSLKTCFQFLVEPVAQLSDFTVEKEFKAIQNIHWKYDVVFLNLIFGQTASWKWLYNECIYIYIYIYIIYILYILYIYNIYIIHKYIYIYIYNSCKFYGISFVHVLSKIGCTFNPSHPNPNEEKKLSQIFIFTMLLQLSLI